VVSSRTWGRVEIGRKLLGNRGQRTRIAPGIYRDQYGLSSTVKVGTIQRERRFKEDAKLLAILADAAAQRVDRGAVSGGAPASKVCVLGGVEHGRE
jgi:hypothetical protein